MRTRLKEPLNRPGYDFSSLNNLITIHLQPLKGVIVKLGDLTRDCSFTADRSVENEDHIYFLRRFIRLLIF